MLTLKNRCSTQSRIAAIYPTIFHGFVIVSSLAIGLSNCPSSQAETFSNINIQTEFAIASEIETKVTFPLLANTPNPTLSNTTSEIQQSERSFFTSQDIPNYLLAGNSSPLPSFESSNKPEIQTKQTGEETDSNEYLVPPTVIPENKIRNVQFTTIPLNNTVINHTTRGEFEPSIIDGSIGVSALYRLEGKVTQSVSKNNVFTFEQTGTYLQTLPFAQERTIELTRKDPITTIGFRLKTSLIGDCALIAKAEAGNWCTFLPGLRFDESSYNPKLLTPTKVIQTTKFGDRVSDEIAASMFQPGFQDTPFAINLYLPNAGSISGNSQSNQSTIERDEITTIVQPLGLTEVDQVFKSNATEQVLGRNRRGFWLIPGDPNFALNSGVQALARVIPKVNPNLDGSKGKPKTAININLYQAANNFYIPNNSLTVGTYEEGRANNPRKNQPHSGAEYSGFWIGLSPVGDRSVTSEKFLVPTGSEITVLSAGGEGGINSDTLRNSLINQNIFSLNPHIYSQSHLDFLIRDVDSVTKIRDTRTYSYFPSISYSYNQTHNNESIRYMAGAIFGDNINAYLGADYTKKWQNLSLSATARYYSKADLDYPSHIGLGLVTPLKIGRNSNINLFVNSNYVFGGAETEFGTVLRPNTLSIGFNAKLGDFNLGATQYISGILPDSTYGTQVNLGVKLGKTFSVNAAAGSINDNITYGIKGSLLLGNKPNKSVVEIGFQRRIIDYNEDSFGNNLQSITDDSQFKLGFRYSY
ncbi:hypothetical protein [Merismopedia glauca]|uniref:Uncharacterized protein n=1 Tax=Merismopedia glauca CCAP 1448/3 TaxID=1296344 RepID=A0A2T1BYP5_9CYAN|nr:hypothetical protein [Merismopedia glauca]PSB01064.1 hypothetical protein C7B64_20285 [Merismopedia glauca CCAP 1448/3]